MDISSAFVCRLDSSIEIESPSQISNLSSAHSSSPVNECSLNPLEDSLTGTRHWEDEKNVEDASPFTIHLYKSMVENYRQLLQIVDDLEEHQRDEIMLLVCSLYNLVSEFEGKVYALQHLLIER